MATAYLIGLPRQKILVRLRIPCDAPEIRHVESEAMRTAQGDIYVLADFYTAGAGFGELDQVLSQNPTLEQPSALLA